MSKRRRHPMKSKDSKKFLREASAKLGTDVEQLLGTKTCVEVSETENVEIYILNGRPLMARSDGTLFFTLFFEELFVLYPKIVVDMGAVPYVCKGADVMAPGVRAVKGEFKENDLLFVVDERHGKPLAVGVALFGSEDMKTVKQGKAVKNLHYVGDKIWNALKSS